MIKKIDKIFKLVVYGWASFLVIMGILFTYKVIHPPVKYLTEIQIEKRVEYQPVYYDVKKICEKVGGVLITPEYNDSNFETISLGGYENSFGCKKGEDIYNWSEVDKTFLLRTFIKLK